jgi:prophage regulatory protein
MPEAKLETDCESPTEAKGSTVADTLRLHSVATDGSAQDHRRPISPLVADARLLARLLRVGIRTVRTWDAAGKLPMPIRIGGRVVWNLKGKWGLRAWLAAGAPHRDEWETRKAADRK